MSNITQHALDVIRSNPRYTQANGSYVSIYRTWQAYGGPEEGGWWKTYWKLEGSVYFPSQEQAEAYLDEVHALVARMQQQENDEARSAFLMNHRDDVDYEDDFCGGESCGPDEITVHIEQEQGSMDNTDEPIGHYE